MNNNKDKPNEMMTKQNTYTQRKEYMNKLKRRSKNINLAYEREKEVNNILHKDINDTKKVSNDLELKNDPIS